MNTTEGFYSAFKCGMEGIRQRYGERHIHRYVGELGYHYGNSTALRVGNQRRNLRGLIGKRPTYRA
jgi:hypothetical protein